MKMSRSKVMNVEEFKKLKIKSTGKVSTSRHKEESLQLRVSKWLKIFYPKVIFTAESSGINRSMHMAVKAKELRSSRGLPDMLILHPMGNYHGLMLELKDGKDKVYLKDGVTFKNNKHLKEQISILWDLKKLGYVVLIACTFNEAKRGIDMYMKGDGKFIFQHLD